MELEKIIRDTLTHFIQSHIPAADLSGMDDVFFSYITGVLEELGLPESSEETFDMDTFVEMMEAYIPGFAEIHSGDVCEMMFSLSESLGEARNKEKTGQKAVESGSEAPSEDLTKGQEPEAGACNGERLRTPTDGAGAQELARPRRAPNHEELKQVILQKYMMVDSADDQKTHRPAPPKEAPKKLIRYIDNQVVSTKGERYKDIKKPESEEMKKTYISIKPARKYKFH
ncbi:CUE domain-containing protein 2 isoform X2 [Aquila chrysaetos chrysaetos]|uniref:CUE domain-containing protein 2 isoform X2 n=1 Tax=Aquila chrysaetos chrysaetos TaxID=223781 RepID=UPI0005D0E1B7|nr:CUE domain-containing protein 2 isoform X2 [Aquila chrysaetos chrysaetos]